ncbi:hypothetical protein E4T56_gene19678, partial [Termitomyces sp. T112]
MLQAEAIGERSHRLPHEEEERVQRHRGGPGAGAEGEHAELQRDEAGAGDHHALHPETWQHAAHGEGVEQSPDSKAGDD